MSGNFSVARLHFWSLMASCYDPAPVWIGVPVMLELPLARSEVHAKRMHSVGTMIRCLE